MNIFNKRKTNLAHQWKNSNVTIFIINNILFTKYGFKNFLIRIWIGSEIIKLIGD